MISTLELKEVKTDNHHVYIGNNTYAWDVLRVVTIRLHLPRQKNLFLIDVLYAPNMKINLLYLPCLDDKGYETCFRCRKVYVGKHGRTLF